MIVKLYPNSDSAGSEGAWHLCLTSTINYSDSQPTVRNTDCLHKYPLSRLVLAETRLQLIQHYMLAQEPRIERICIVEVLEKQAILSNQW